MPEIQNTGINFTREDIKNLVSTVHNFFDKTGQIFNQYNNEPSPNSLASSEISNFPTPELVSTAYSLGTISMESAADHLMAFANLVSEPVKTIAPWTCVRGLLESCAMAYWFLDPSIDAMNRVGRSFAFRFKGFEEQIKYFRKINDQSKMDFAQNRIIKVENDAMALGFPQLLNDKGRVNGIAQYMPSITDLIETTLNGESDYRLLSAVAHGHHWATHQIGFRVVEMENPQGKLAKALIKTAHPNFIMYIGLIAVTSFSKVLWNMWQLYGWNLDELKNLLELTYDQLKYSSQVRFWRMPS